jgi:endonuclease YncB( thermonuclease family)
MLVCLSAAVAQKASPSKPFERFDGCVLKPDEWTDGDSFRVQLPDGRLETFRLYFVDTTESRSRGERSDEQAAYFGLTRAQAIELGRQAKIFTANALAQPFTIYTRWRSVFGARYYAIVVTSDGHDLNELLVSDGLARIYGTEATALSSWCLRLHHSFSCSFGGIANYGSRPSARQLSWLSRFSISNRR